MIDELNLILNALNTITVSGEDNLNKLLGSIQHLRKMRDELINKEKGDDA